MPANTERLSALQRRNGRRKRPRRGRPPGIRAERRAELAQMVRAGLTLGEIAQAIGVSRQCIHQQLLKCPELARERQTRRASLLAAQRREAQRLRGVRWITHHAHGGSALLEFLERASAHGWSVSLAPRHRARINGVPLAFHLPRHLRRTGYYHVQLTRSDWLHVVCLPTGRYLFFLPDRRRRVGSCYIRATVADEPQQWPEWPHARRGCATVPDGGKAGTNGKRKLGSAWAA